MSFRTTYEGSTMKRNLVCTFTAGDVPYARLTLPRTTGGTSSRGPRCTRRRGSVTT